ncbi:MAG: hypothetical protein K5761_03575, partial [Clostridiales bacterium]|nr:hypothetical protein [Clostridiales bacterium]
SIAENYFGEHVVYLHGKLNLFENLNDLQVYTSQELLSSGVDLKENTIIPFILIPSGVKPLICTKQIEAFHDFINTLNDKNCNELCVIGYKFNSEDNHVNSIVGEWLKKEKHHMTVFDYSDDIDFSSYSWAKDFPLDEFEMKSPKDTISIDFGKNKIRRYYIDSKENDYSKKDRIINSCFSTYVKLLEKERLLWQK